MDIQLENFNPLFDSLTGLTKIIAKRILGRDFVEAINKIQINDGAVDANDAVKDMIKIAARKVTNAIRRKIAVIFTIITGIIGIIITLVTLAANGNVIIPIVIFAVIIVIIWVVTGKIFNAIAQKVSDKILSSIKTLPVMGHAQ
jgi:membrane glycosyltransferase